ncbi:Spore coat protein CotO [Mesobacillus persicus]|uniref:Spore coat protein CotO n=1 Tax=Mesobacillus persicus TaxID=930146 RepID=A0A1H8E8G8_9BACI|nr:CotO family spore coat protein [Mesobacillus persicus]SEN15696.1 Spore coat protein CotO [Mesobacillus persicus]
MSSRKVKHKPVLYISQPITKFPDVVMQYRYSTREESSKKIKKDKSLMANELNENVLKTVTDSSIGEEKFSETVTVQEDFLEEAEADLTPFDTSRKRKYSFQRVKNFKEMSISEKIIYLENFPEQLAPVSCLYFTEQTTYTGVFLKNLEHQVEITLPNKTNVTIDKSEILEIRMLGFH